MACESIVPDGNSSAAYSLKKGLFSTPYMHAFSTLEKSRSAFICGTCLALGYSCFVVFASRTRHGKGKRLVGRYIHEHCVGFLLLRRCEMMQTFMQCVKRTCVFSALNALLKPQYFFGGEMQSFGNVTPMVFIALQRCP